VTLKSAHAGQVPVVPYSNQHPKAGQPGRERYLFHSNGRHIPPQASATAARSPRTHKARIRHHAIVAVMDDARLAVRVIEPDEEPSAFVVSWRRLTNTRPKFFSAMALYIRSCLATAATPVCTFAAGKRAFSIGCPFLVRRPESDDRVEFVLDRRCC
jgi:hypothetical protein